MIWLSWRTLRSRWQVFIGTLLALTLGVSLMTTTLLCVAGALAQTQASGEEEFLLSLAITLLGNAAAVSTAAAVFVVTGTFAFTVAQRRREFALLRAIGATPRQVRRLVIGESIFIGITAAIAGCLLGLAVAPHFARWMSSVELAPPGFEPAVTWWPLVIAAVVGFLSALLSAWFAARRASKVHPMEALVEASIDKRIMNPIRWVTAVVALAGAGLLIPLVSSAGTGVGAAYILLEILLLIFVIIMIIPVLVPLLTRIVGWGLRSTASYLAKANIRTGVRRSSSMVAPMFITLGLAAAAFTSVATLSQISDQATEERITAPLVITADYGGLDSEAVAALKEAGDGAVIEPVAESSALLVKGSERNSDTAPVLYAQPTITRALQLPLAAGSLDAFADGDGLIVSEDMASARHWRVGDQMDLWLAGDKKVSLEVAAVMQNAADDVGSSILLPDSLRQELELDVQVQTVYAAPAEGESVGALQSLLEPIASSNGAQLMTTDDYLAQQREQNARVDRVALLTVIGLAVFYTAISIANTSVMATTGRFRDFAVLRLSGATRKQILGMVIIETCLLLFIAAVAALLVTAGALAVTHISFGGAAGFHIVMPWLPVALVFLACFGIAFTASVLSALWSFRTPAIRIAASRE